MEGFPFQAGAAGKALAEGDTRASGSGDSSDAANLRTGLRGYELYAPKAPGPDGMLPPSFAGPTPTGYIYDPALVEAGMGGGTYSNYGRGASSSVGTGRVLGMLLDAASSPAAGADGTNFVAQRGSPPVQYVSPQLGPVPAYSPTFANVAAQGMTPGYSPLRNAIGERNSFSVDTRCSTQQQCAIDSRLAKCYQAGTTGVSLQGQPSSFRTNASATSTGAGGDLNNFDAELANLLGFSPSKSHPVYTQAQTAIRADGSIGESFSDYLMGATKARHHRSIGQTHNYQSDSNQQLQQHTSRQIPVRPQQREKVAAEITQFPAQPCSFSSGLFDPDKVFSVQMGKTSPPLSASKSAIPSAPVCAKDEILSNFRMTVANLSTAPMSAQEVLDKVGVRTDEVITLYLPCTDFLVQCQQELRAGLAAATKKKYVRGRYQNSMTARKFYKTYIEPLPTKFFRQHQQIMPLESLQAAYTGVQSLCKDASRASTSGCDAMKNSFLGGMREGQSWGLRKWLSKNGGALVICNDLELILGAIRKLDKSLPTTKRMAEIIRPRAKQAFDRLKADVPKAYQAHSSAHPYLPFFHRLEGVLKGLATFDPEDDDVVCLDDESDEEKNSIANADPISSTRADTSNRKRPPAMVDVPKERGDRDNRHTKKPKLEGGQDLFSNESHHVIRHALHQEAERRETRGNAVVEIKPVTVTEVDVINLMNSSDEEEEGKIVNSNNGKKGTTVGKEIQALFAADSSSAEPNTNKLPEQEKKGWRCHQCTFWNSAETSNCQMCGDDENDAAFDDDSVLKALIGDSLDKWT